MKTKDTGFLCKISTCIRIRRPITCFSRKTVQNFRLYAGVLHKLPLTLHTSGFFAHFPGNSINARKNAAYKWLFCTESASLFRMTPRPGYIDYRADCEEGNWLMAGSSSNHN